MQFITRTASSCTLLTVKVVHSSDGVVGISFVIGCDSVDYYIEIPIDDNGCLELLNILVVTFKCKIYKQTLIKYVNEEAGS